MRAVVVLRLAGVLGLAVMALSSTFLVVAAAYALRTLFQSMTNPIQQSFLMGVSSEESRSGMVGLASIPGQAALSVSPSLGTALMQSLSQSAPLWLGTGLMGVSTLLYGLLFHRMVPPEERTLHPPSVQPRLEESHV